MSEPIRRKIGVCLEKFCKRCSGLQKLMPDSCPFKILQLLDNGVGMGEIEWRPRRSGKTTRLVKLANQLANAGYSVVYLVPNWDMANHLSHMVAKEVRMMSFYQVRDHGHLRGIKPSIVILDELRPEQMKELDESLRFHQVVAAHWS